MFSTIKLMRGLSVLLLLSLSLHVGADWLSLRLPAAQGSGACAPHNTALTCVNEHSPNADFEVADLNRTSLASARPGLNVRQIDSRLHLGSLALSPLTPPPPAS